MSEYEVGHHAGTVGFQLGYGLSDSPYGPGDEFHRGYIDGWLDAETKKGGSSRGGNEKRSSNTRPLPMRIGCVSPNA